MANLLFAPENLTRSGLKTPEGVSLHAGWYNLVHERLLEWALTPPLWHADAAGGRPHHQALPARGLELDLIFGLPSGPAAWNAPQQRPNTCQHPTTCHTAPEDFSCSSRGVHTCRKVWNGRETGWMRPDFTEATRGKPSPETNPIRPLFTCSRTLQQA